MSSPTFSLLTQEVIVSRLRQAVKHSVQTFDATPEDKLDYKPTSTSRSVRDLGQHIITGHNLVAGSLGLSADGDDEIIDAEELSAELARTGRAIVEFAGGLDEVGLEKPVEFFGQTFPTMTLLVISEWHTSRHAGQIDYLQTTWDDMEDRFF